MGKRSDFERIERDHYPSPPEAMWPLLHYLPFRRKFAEVCAGGGRMVDFFELHGHECTYACDIHPLRRGIRKRAATDVRIEDVNGAEMFITNPPWEREWLHPIIDHLSSLLPTWVIIDADWAHNVTEPVPSLVARCAMIVPIGRIKWIPGSEHSGKENVCWYLLLPGHTEGPMFRPRRAPIRSKIKR